MPNRGAGSRVFRSRLERLACGANRQSGDKQRVSPVEVGVGKVSMQGSSLLAEVAEASPDRGRSIIFQAPAAPVLANDREHEKLC